MTASAWDIAGAVVWTGLAVLFMAGIVNPGTNDDGKVLCLVSIGGFSLAAVFCIARLMGAHA